MYGRFFYTYPLRTVVICLQAVNWVYSFISLRQ